MSETPDAEHRRVAGPVASRAPYRKPMLTVYGPVASITRALGPAGATKDGGPNNTKS